MRRVHQKQKHAAQPQEKRSADGGYTARSKVPRTPLLLCLFVLTLMTVFVLDNGPVFAPQFKIATRAKSPVPTKPLPPGLSLPKDFTLQDKIGQLLMVGATSKAMAADLEQKYEIGGFLLRPGSDLFSKSATAAVKQAGELPPLIAIDQEGGQVSRLPGIDFSADSAAYIGKLPDTEVTLLGQNMGRAMANIGATVDFAPVVDLDDGHNDAISLLDRSFSNDPTIVAEKAQAFARGLRTAGIVPTFKHFPGLGYATGVTNGNTDTGSATAPPLAILEQRDLLPYATLLQSSAISTVMVGNQIVPGLSDGLPASLSSNTYTLLRERYGFTQVVFTDELLDAKAVANTQPGPTDAVIAAIKAGADMPLIDPADEQTVSAIIDGITRAVRSGELRESQVDASLARILHLKTAIQQN